MDTEGCKVAAIVLHVIFMLEDFIFINRQKTVQLFTGAGKIKTWDAYTYEERKENSMAAILTVGY